MTPPRERTADVPRDASCTVLSRITRGELLTLLAVAIFAEMLTLGWIAALLGVDEGRATWAQAMGVAAADLLSLAWLPVPLFFWYDRFPLVGAMRARHLALRAVGVALMLAISAWSSTAALRVAGTGLGIPRDVLALLSPGWPEQVFWASCGVFGVSIAYLVLRRLHDARELEQRNAELRRLALEAQLSALAAELRPHFLFNALNDLAELVHHDPARAEAMLLHLSSLLQASLSAGRQRTVTLAEELQHVDDYLAVQQMRFDDRLTITRDVDASALTARVPPMLLQPLVENAVVHGIEGRVGASHVHLRVRAAADVLEVQVDDDGPGPRATADGGRSREARDHVTGTGLRNVRERLAALYGAAGEAVLSERPGGGARMSVRFPLEVA